MRREADASELIQGARLVLGEGGERDIRAVEIPQRARHRLHGQVVRIALA